MEKVLIANGGYYPAKNYGGPVVSIDNICSLLKDNCVFYIICSNHELGEAKILEGISNGWNERSNCYVVYLDESEINEKYLLKIVKEIAPSIIYINSLFDAKWTLPLLKIAHEHSYNVLLAPRGQLCENAFSKKYKKLPYIWLLKIRRYLDDIRFQATSDEEIRCIKKYLGGSDDRIFFLTNLPSIPAVQMEYTDKIPGKAKFIFFSRITRKKNLHMAIDLFSYIKGNAVFDIYGPIENQEYWDSCQKQIQRLPDNIEVNYCGTIDHDEVFKTLSQYDAFLFPTLSENYGHVISEALFAGCPVIISNTTPWVGLEAAGAGWDIDLADKEAFVNAITKVISYDKQAEEGARKKAQEHARKAFDLEKMKRDYMNALLIK